LYERTLADKARVLGEGHPDTLIGRGNLGVAYTTAGRFDEAIALHREALVGLERALGAQHPDTVVERDNLARTMRAAARRERGSGQAGPPA
jgi:hypothetical protein